MRGVVSGEPAAEFEELWRQDGLFVAELEHRLERRVPLAAGDVDAKGFDGSLALAEGDGDAHSGSEAIFEFRRDEIAVGLIDRGERGDGGDERGGEPGFVEEGAGEAVAWHKELRITNGE